MRILRQAASALALALMATVAAASPADPKNGVDYLTLPEPQATEASGKVEVIEFFSYMCPHCNAFDPSIHAWVKKQGNAIAFRRVPIAFYPQWEPLAKIHYAIEALGRAEELHPKVFAAVHVERQRIESDAAALDLLVRLGVDRKQAADVYHSFGIQSKLRQAARLQEAYKITGVPMVAVAGRYLTSPGTLSDNGLRQPPAELYNSTLQVLDWLVARQKK